MGRDDLSLPLEPPLKRVHNRLGDSGYTHATSDERLPSSTFHLDVFRTPIYSFPDEDSDRPYCDGVGHVELPRRVEASPHAPTITSDVELFQLRSPGRFFCNEGTCVWLRPWHDTRYKGRDLSAHRMGYVFPICMSGHDDGGWTPDPGMFYLEHDLAWGQWPSHDSKLRVLQLLLSIQLGPNYQVLRPKHLLLGFKEPYERCRDF